MPFDPTILFPIIKEARAEVGDDGVQAHPIIPNKRKEEEAKEEAKGWKV